MPDTDNILQLMQEALRRIEAKLDMLIEALAEEDSEAAVPMTLDGMVTGMDRDQTQSLG